MCALPISSAPAPQKKGPPPPNPKPADEPRGAAVDEKPRRSFVGRLVRLAVIAAVLLFAALVTRSIVVDGVPDLSSEEGWVSFIRSMFRSGRDLRDRSQNFVAQIKQEMSGVEDWLKDRKIELPSTDDLLKKADDLLSSARDQVDTAMAPPVPTYAPPPPPPEPAPTQVAQATPKPQPTPPPPAVTVPKPEPAPVATPRPLPTPGPVTGPVGAPTPPPVSTTAPVPKPTPTPPPPVAVTPPPPAPEPVATTRPKPEPGVVTVPVTVLPTHSTPAPRPEPAVQAPPPPPANPALAEAQAVFREGLEHYRNTKHGSPDMQKELRESAKLFRKAQGLLSDAAQAEPKNGKIEELQVQVNRFLYDSLKRQTL